MQAIITKYVGPTNYKGSRISAKCEAGRVIINWDDAMGQEENHRAACNELCRQLDAQNVRKYGTKAEQWTKPKASGQLPDGSYAHVFIP